MGDKSEIKKGDRELLRDRNKEASCPGGIQAEVTASA
jgi:hypothetical protein